MADRRDFLKASLAAAAVAALPAGEALAYRNCMMGGCALPGGIVYTKENPGKWAKKVGGHLPKVTIDGGKVTIETKHGMSEKHYIVRHTLVADDGTVIGEKTFYPSDEKAVSVFELPKGCKCRMLYATSFCNLHDLWVAPVKLDG